VLAASLTEGVGDAPALSAAGIGLHNTHSWALLAVIILAVVTGWGAARRVKESE